MAWDPSRAFALNSFLQKAVREGQTLSQHVSSLPEEFRGTQLSSTLVVPATNAASALRQKLVSVGVPLVAPQISVGVPQCGPTLIQQRAKVLAGIVERAISMASTKCMQTIKVLYQRRVGRAIHTVEPWRVPYMVLMGTIAGLRLAQSPVVGPVDHLVASVDRCASVATVDGSDHFELPPIHNMYLWNDDGWDEEEEEEFVFPNKGAQNWGPFHSVEHKQIPQEEEREYGIFPLVTDDQLLEMLNSIKALFLWDFYEKLNDYRYVDLWDTIFPKLGDDEFGCISCEKETGTLCSSPYADNQSETASLELDVPTTCVMPVVFSEAISSSKGDTLQFFEGYDTLSGLHRAHVGSVSNRYTFRELNRTEIYRYVRGEENYVFPPVERKYATPYELQSAATCTSVIHMCSTIDGTRYGDIFYLHQCFYCALDALAAEHIQEMQNRVRRCALFARQFEKFPPAEIKKGGLLNTCTKVGSVFNGIVRHATFSSIKSLPAVRARIHSEREKEDISAKLAERAEEDHMNRGTTLAAVKAALQSKKGKHVIDSYEGRLGDDSTKLQEKDVFIKVKHDSTFKQLKRRVLKDKAGLRTEQTFPLTCESVRIGRNKMEPIYTPLPTLGESQLRRLLDHMEMRNTSVVALDIAVQSHIPQGTPMIAFSTIMDGRTNDPNVAAQSGAYLHLGRDRCQLLSLPLVNFDLNDLYKRLGNDDPELYLATYINDTFGYRPDTVIFTYGTSGLLEHKPDAYTNQTLCKNAWNDILDTHLAAGNRIVKGFNVIDVMAQDYDQPLVDFEEIQFRTRQSSTPIPTRVFTARGIRELPPSLQGLRSVSMARTQFGKNSGIVAQSPYVDEPKIFANTGSLNSGSSSYHIRNSSSSENLVAPRFSHVQTAQENPHVVASSSRYIVAKDAKGGDLIGIIDFFEAIRKARRPFYYDWAAAGMLDPDVRIRTYTGSNQFVGTTIAITHDFFDKMKVINSLGNVVPMELANCMPTALHPLSAGTTMEHVVNFEKYVGQNLYINQPTFAKPQFIFSIYATNAVTMESDWAMTVEILVRKKAESMTLALRPMLTVPQDPSEYVDLDIYKGFGEIALSSRPRVVRIAMDFAEKKVFAEGRCALGLTQAIFRTVQGSSGILHGRLIRTGSCMVSCVVRLVMWWGDIEPNFDETSMYPHVNIDLDKDDGSFSLKIQSAFARFSNRNQKAMLLIYPLGGPTATKGFGSSFQFAIYLKGISVAEPMPPVLLPQQDYVWMVMEPEATTTGKYHFMIPNHVCDYRPAGWNVKWRPNPLSYIFGSCGFFGGTLTMTVSWANAGGIVIPNSAIKISKCYGVDLDTCEALETVMCNASIAGSHSIPLQVGDFSGYNKPGGTGNPMQFMSLFLAEAKSIYTITLSVKLHEGFSFYGRSCIPTYTGNTQLR